MGRMFAFVLLTTGCAAAQRRGWTATDTTIQATFTAMAVVDYYQTRRITAGCTEDNPVMGNCGQYVPPAVYFPVAEAAFVVTSWYLPKPWRRTLEGFVLGGEGSVVYRNTKHLQLEVRQ